MKTRFKIIVIFIVSFLLEIQFAFAKVVTIASGANGSLAFNTGQAVAKIANQKARIPARTQPLTGYLPLINNGEIDFGFTNAVEVGYAVNGTGNFKGRKNPNLRIVGVMFPLRTGLMVSANSGIKTIADLKARANSLRIASLYTASNIIPYYIKAALANGDLVYDDFIKVPISSFVKGMQALGDGLVDVTLISLNSGASKKVEAQLRNEGGLQYVSLDMSKEAIKKFKKFLPKASIVNFRANKNIPGLKQAANIIEIPWIMVTNKDVSEDLVYKMTKVIAQHNKELKKSFGAFKNMNPKKMMQDLGVKYHKGSLKYYKEVKLQNNL